MKINKKLIKIHGGREVNVLSPANVDPRISAGHNNKGYVVIWGNGSSYKFLAECFMISAELRENEILYLPVRFQASGEFKDTFACEYNYNIICMNYCQTQMKPKDIHRALQTKVYSEEIIQCSPPVNTDYVDHWKTYRRMTVKFHKRNMYISTNGDGFTMLAYGCNDMAGYGDQKYDSFLPHRHYDMDENTSKSTGVTLYHWHDE